MRDSRDGAREILARRIAVATTDRLAVVTGDV
jgi:hypothetical protein